MASKQITTDHEDYDAIHADWRRNGSPGQFDRAGKADLGYGGAVYRVLDVEAENPIFYQYASLGPTTWDEDNKGKVTKGWDFINEEGWYQKLWQDRGGRFHTEMKDAPNIL